MQVNLDGIGKRYGREWILQDIALDLTSGSHTALLGGNGSGKSTLIRTISGLLNPSKGTITYTHDGQNIAASDVYQHISMVAPYLDLYEQLTLSELLKLHFSLRSWRPHFGPEQLYEMTHLPKDTALSAFSSGMLQRVKLALAFCTESSLMLLDEPTMNLDQAGTDWFITSLKGLPNHVTVLIASNMADSETGTCSAFYRIEGKGLQQLDMG